MPTPLVIESFVATVVTPPVDTSPDVVIHVVTVAVPTATLVNGRPS